MEKRTIPQGGEFLIRQTRLEDVFIPEELTNEQKMVHKAALDFVNKELAENAELIEEKNQDQVRKWFAMAGELGLNAIDFPEEYGGESMDKICACLVTEAMGGGHSFGASHTCQTGIGSLPILLYGNEAQKQKYLPKLASGEWIGAYCLTEAGSGSDALAAKASATLSEDGKHFLLNGEKIYVTNGGWADVLTVFAKVDGEKFTAFILEKGMEGLSRGPEEDKLGIRGSSTVSIILKDCKVPVENVLYEIGQGHKIAFNVLNIGRYKLAPACLGGMKRAIAVSIRYALEREQFGRKIAEFGLIREKLAQMAVDAYVAESMAYRLAAAINDKLEALTDEEKQSGEAVSRAIEDYSIECSLVKVAGSELLDRTVDEMVQLFGGAGYIADYPAERAYRDSRINRIFEGTNEINRMLAAGNFLKRAVADKLPVFAAVEKAKSLELNDEAGDGFLSVQVNTLEACKAIFLVTLTEAATRLTTRIAQEQEVLGLLADMMIRIYLMDSALVRAGKAAASKGVGKAQLHAAAAKVYVGQSLPELASMAKQILAYIAGGDNLAPVFSMVGKLASRPQENIVGLKQLLAGKVIKAKRYPF